MNEPNWAHGHCVRITPEGETSVKERLRGCCRACFFSGAAGPVITVTSGAGVGL